LKLYEPPIDVDLADEALPNPPTAVRWLGTQVIAAPRDRE
jgi:hypothetical protein